MIQLNQVLMAHMRHNSMRRNYKYVIHCSRVRFQLFSDSRLTLINVSKAIHTFGNKNHGTHKSGYSERLVRFVMDSKFDRTYTVWFLCMMVAVFTATLMAQRHKYTYSGTESSGSEIMDIDQLEVCLN